jgi:hypothetical protein
MPDKPPRLPRLDNFASFGPDALGQVRRKPTWPLRPMHEPSAGEATDAARRFVGEAELLQGLGCKPTE